MLASLVSFLLLTAPTNPSIEVIRQHHLETQEGRIGFLTEELSPFATAADQLNQEITALSEQIKLLSPTEDQEEILTLSNLVTERMALMNWMVPSLELAMHVDEDLQQVDEILSADELTPEQQEAAERIATLCLYIDEYNRE